MTKQDASFSRGDFHLREQEALLRLSCTLLGLLDPAAIARAAIAIIREHVQPDAISLMVCDSERTNLDLVAGDGWSQAFVGHLRVPMIPPDSCGPARALHTRSCVLEDYGRPTLPVATPDVVRTAGVRVSLSVPMVIDQRPVGVLVVDSLTPRRYSDDEVRLLSLIANQTSIALALARAHEELEDTDTQAVVLALANAVDARDTYTADHGQRLAELAVATARELGGSQDEIQTLYWAALVHDIGKIAITDAILHKLDPLTEEEWAAIKRHPEIGAQIVVPVKRLHPAIPIIRYHHEKWDGTGYPDGLKGDAIPQGARILAVADAYVAMTDERVYRRARSHDDAMAEVHRSAGTHFDPRVVEAFSRVLRVPQEPSFRPDHGSLPER